MSPLFVLINLKLKFILSTITNGDRYKQEIVIFFKQSEVVFY